MHLITLALLGTFHDSRGGGSLLMRRGRGFCPFSGKCKLAHLRTGKERVRSYFSAVCNDKHHQNHVLRGAEDEPSHRDTQKQGAIGLQAVPAAEAKM